MNEPPDEEPISGTEPETHTEVEATPKPSSEIMQRLRPFVPPERIEGAARVVQSMLIAQSHSGPIPSSRELAGYERALTGAADRIVSMAEREQTHRHSIESTVVRTEVSLKARGQIFALIALGMSLAVVALMAYLGQSKAAAALGAAIIVSVVGLFLGNKFLPNFSGASASSDQEDDAGENKSDESSPKNLPKTSEDGA